MNSCSRRPGAGFSLVEVALALGIASFCLVTLFGLLPVGLSSHKNSVDETAANGIFSEIIADLRATPVTLPPGKATTTSLFSIPIPANPVSAATLPTPTTLYFTRDGQCSTTLTSSSLYRASITFLPNGTSAQGACLTRIQSTWPASVLPANALSSVQTFVALNRN